MEASVLLSVTGASGSGKSSTLAALEAAFEDQPISCVEFDSIGIPPDADTAWRHGALEGWVQHAVDAQHSGRDLLLCGQVPVGELLASPSTPLLDGVAAVLLHCSPEVRRERLVGRGQDANGLYHHLAFGEWFHAHMRDPTFMQEVIRVPGEVPMRWDRWEHWQPGDPRWTFEIIDTDRLTRQEVADRAVKWAREAMVERRGPLSGEWWAG